MQRRLRSSRLGLSTSLMTLLAVVASLLGGALQATPAHAISTMIVGTATDELTANGTCSLREALHNLNNSNNTYTECGDGASTTIINFAADYTIELTLASALTVSRPVLIGGRGFGSSIIQAGPSTCVGAPCTQTWGVFSMTHSSGVVTLDSLTVRYGRGGSGGGISNSSNGGSVTVRKSLITENYGGNGGGLYNGGGTMFVDRSTLLHNQTNTSGGGAYNIATMNIARSLFSSHNGPGAAGFFNSSAGTMNVYNSTFYGNSTSGTGGGGWNEGLLYLTNDTFSGNTATTKGSSIYNATGATLHMSNTILTGASGTLTPNDCYNEGGDTIATNNTNWIDINAASPHMCGTPSYTGQPWNPVTTVPADYGGDTLTINSGTTANIYNVGNTTVCASAPVAGIDQRGTKRDGGGCDIGAFEYHGTPTNDDYTGSTGVGSLPWSDSIDTGGATTAVGDPSSCTGQRYHTVWYDYTPGSDQLVAVNTYGSNYDTMLAVRTGVPPSAAVKCSDDSFGFGQQSGLVFAASGGTTYWIEAMAFTFGGGTLNLQVYALNADTVGAYDGASSTFFLRNANSAGPADNTFGYGWSGPTPLVGDWNADGAETVGLDSAGTFFLRNANSPGPADYTFGYAWAGATPLIGDWDANGSDTVGVYDSGSGTFFLRNINSAGSADVTFSYGWPGATPLVGDWNGDGVDTIGIYDSATSTFFLRNDNSAGAADYVFTFGWSGPTPIVGDWDGDGDTTVGIDASGTYFLRNSNSAGAADSVFSYAWASATPLAGTWDLIP